MCANVIIVMRVMPEGLETDLGSLSGKLTELGAKSVAKKPVAFGLSCLETVFSIPDQEGGMDKLEKDVAEIPGVSSAEVISMGREIDGKL